MMTMKKRSRVAVAASTAALTTASLFAFAAPAGAAAVPPDAPLEATATAQANRINVKWERGLGEPATAHVILAWDSTDGCAPGDAPESESDLLTEVVLEPGVSGSILEVPAGEYCVWVAAHNAYSAGYWWYDSAIQADGSPLTVPEVGDPEDPDPDTRPYRPFDNWDGVINQEYQDWLGRAPRLDELTFWRHYITNNDCYSLLDSVWDEHPSFRCRIEFVAWLAEEVEQTAGPAYRLYTAYFARNPEFAGLKFWHNSLRTNRSLLQVSDFFVESTEFENRYGGYATNAPEGPATDAAEFVALIYSNVLNRTPDGSGFSFWTRQLQTERMTPGEVMIGFSESQEFKNRMSTRVATGLAYTFMLERTPTEDEYVLAEFFDRGFLTSADPDFFGHWGTGELYLYIIDSAEYIGRV